MSDHAVDSEQVRIDIENSKSKLYDRDGHSINIMRYKGISFLAIPTLPSALSKVDKLPLRSDDVFICAFPSSGTHWIWEVASMVLKEKAERISNIKEEFMLDFSPQKQLELKESPRLLNTHLYPHFLPKALLKDNKIIFVVRNCKDVVVSFYGHVFNAYKFEYDGSFPSFFELFIRGDVPFGDYFEYIRQWWQVTKANPNALIVTYEEASKDLPKVVSTIATFLGKPINNQLAVDIADLCSFDNMKKEKKDARRGSISPGSKKKDGMVYRTGKVSAWKNWLTVAQSERMDARIQTEFIDRGIDINVTACGFYS